MCYWWKHSSQRQQKHSMKHQASYNLLPLSPCQFYAIIIQNWAFIIILHNLNTTLGGVHTLPLPGSRLFRGAWPHTCAARQAVVSLKAHLVRFQQYTVKRHTSPVTDPACQLLHLSIGVRLRGRKAAPKRLGVGERRTLRRRGAQRREGRRTKARGPRSTHRSPGTASWTAGTARSAHRNPLGPERPVRAPGRSQSPR